MAKRKLSDRPQWFRDMVARLRAERNAGDASPSDFLEHAADEIERRHRDGDPLGRAIWIEFVGGYDRDVSKAQHDRADEAMDLEFASGFLQPDLFPAEVLAELSLPPELDLGSFGKRVMTAAACYADVEKYLAELKRKRKSWDESLDERIEAAERTLAILPRDNSLTLREVIADPGDYGFGAAAL